jgi:hypothetical protein
VHTRQNPHQLFHLNKFYVEGYKILLETAPRVVLGGLERKCYDEGISKSFRTESNEIYAYNKHSLRSNTKDYGGGKTH